MAISFTKLYFNEPSPMARRLLWHVLSVGTVTRDEPERHEGSDKPGAFLFWIVSGRGELELEPGSVRMEPGPRAWLLDLRKPRTYLPAGGRPLTTAGIRFDGPALEPWLEQLGGDSEFRLSKPGDAGLIRRAEKLLVDLVTRRPGGYEWQAHLLITEVLGTLLHARKILSEPAREMSGPVTRVVQAVLAAPARDWKARELAKIAGVGYTKLRNLFKQSQQETLHQFLQRTRLDQARLLLCDPRLTVKDVAGRLNFSSEFYFSHFFREATGMSPTQFRLKSKS